MSLSRIAPVFLVLATACSPIALSPATRTIPLETAETAREGHVAIRAGGGAHTLVGVGGAGIGVGVAEDVEVQAEGSFGYVESLDTPSRGVAPWIGTGRIGVKHRLADFVALTGGIGAGNGPWGAFTGGDLGIVLAYENPYAIPFFAARMQLSLPIDGRTESVVDSNMHVTTVTPGTTWWFQPSTGVRIPFCRTDDDCGGTRVSLTVAVAWTQVFEPSANVDAAALGVEGGLTIEP